MFISDRTNRNARRGHKLKQFGELKASYVKIPNELVDDRTISWKAKGLFCHMASKLDTYNFTVKSLASQFPDGKSAIFSALDELKNSGWITYTRKAGGYGKYKLNTTILSKPENRIEAYTESDNRTKDSELESDNRTKESILNSDYQMSDNRMVRKSDGINNTDSINNTNLYKGEDKKISENNEKQEQDHISALSAIKLGTDQVIEHIRTGVLNANRQQS